MDDLDRQIEEAAQIARSRIWRRRRAWATAMAVFFATAIIGAVGMYSLFPDMDDGELRELECARKARGEHLDMRGVAQNYSAHRRDRARAQWKIYVVIAIAFGSAILVLNRLEPKDSDT